MNYRRFTFVLLISLCALTAQAQSGRRQTKPAPAAPVPTPTPEPTPKPKKAESESELLFVLGADRHGSFTNLPYSYFDAVLLGCGERLRSGSSASVDVSQQSISRGEAIKRAKSEAGGYVVWINLTIDSMARSYDDLEVEYVVFAPSTAKVLTSGRTYLNGNRKGPIVVGPRGSTNGIYREQLLKQAGEDAGSRILKALHLTVEVQR
jgi:hypothetical protein